VAVTPVWQRNSSAPGATVGQQQQAAATSGTAAPAAGQSTSTPAGVNAAHNSSPAGRYPSVTARTRVGCDKNVAKPWAV
jgi:hypothetical protein